MKEFKFLLLCVTITLSILGCNSSESVSTQNSDLCPTCNMQIDDSKLYTSTLHINTKVHNFDDIGCMILFCQENHLNLETIESKVFTIDTKRYINSATAYYKIDESTPMNYGFAAFEKKELNTIKFDEVIMKMLRGEHMANPKIRKQILGNRV